MSKPARSPDRSRDEVLAEGVARLEREHFALLVAANEDCDESVSGIGMALQALLRDDLRRTQRALTRASLGRFGECERCERPLSARQLELDPTATLCLRCTSQHGDTGSFS